MISFRDMTFCPFYKDCNRANRCPRPLTEEVINQAKEWWKEDDPPIAVFNGKPDCHEIKP